MPGLRGQFLDAPARVARPHRLNRRFRAFSHPYRRCFIRCQLLDLTSGIIVLPGLCGLASASMPVLQQWLHNSRFGCVMTGLRLPILLLFRERLQLCFNPGFTSVFTFGWNLDFRHSFVPSLGRRNTHEFDFRNVCGFSHYFSLRGTAGFDSPSLSNVFSYNFVLQYDFAFQFDIDRPGHRNQNFHACRCLLLYFSGWRYRTRTGFHL